jgi:hypothetical protein
MHLAWDDDAAHAELPQDPRLHVAERLGCVAVPRA